MSNKEKPDLNRIKELPTPTKNIFEDFLLTAASHKMPVFKKNAKESKNSREYSFTGEFIAIFRTMFINMFHNRIKQEFDYQEICYLSFSQIAKHSRFSRDVVKRAIQYALMAGIFEQVPTKLKSKCKYKVGQFNYKSYSQKLLTSENLGATGT